MMLYTKLILLISILFFSTATYAAEPEHDDKAHEKAEKNLDDKHWNDAHGSGVPEKKGRNPGGKKESKSKKEKE
ncbi:hypothetical protein [Shewanella woodyi]|uniref:Secreted protein n=1 Tax=Shewanella woodyi (strain ATCC 51908 / MS32) TaxID=392500 RepID=B1KH10_SHEWM|nr:hypothetical protein [Shewanella woodyi]ACA88322.1 hypothetical protein Swoo_4066 [Shewanella woodyi ATCC 51908]